MNWPITYRTFGYPKRREGIATGETMQAALDQFKRDNPRTVSHCIYNPEHLESKS